ncbi:MAG: DUF2807 domain-containing protein [Bacteroidetes bacterium]|nr:DUF2807 domain-containing protein [Bacteroidota bacterium]
MKKIYPSLLLAGIFVFLASCIWKTIKGNGEIVSQTRTIQGFNKVKSAGDFQVHLTQRAGYEVIVSTDSNLQEFVETELQGNTLVLRTARGKMLRPTKAIHVYIAAPDYSELTLAGSGKISSDGRIAVKEQIELHIAGSGDIVLNGLDVPKLQGKIAGSGKIELSGETREANYQIAGSGDLLCKDFKSEATKINIAGSGDAWVFASKVLEARVAGSGDIHYYGQPAEIKTSVAGSGKLIKQ